MDYQEFLESKKQVIENLGFEVDSLPNFLFGYQQDLVKWALKKGRAAIFADTGLGKTVMQLIWADEVRKKLNQNVLILAPLAIVTQTLKEAGNFNIKASQLGDDLDPFQSSIFVTNYEQIHNIDFDNFCGIILDESSILKHKDSKTRAKIIESVQKINYRLSLTATPAPNDYMEFGSQSEFLGIMTQESMWATFFTHDSAETSKWRLKGHSQKDFWEWVSSWAVIFRKPSDLGHPKDDFILPEINYVNHTIDSGLNQKDYLEKNGMGLLGRNRARKDTLEKRVDECVEIVKKIKAENPQEPILIWCHLNGESQTIYQKVREFFSDVVEVTGQDSEEKKRDGMLGFSSGRYSILITKPKIAGFGMNWQHCANMIFVGLNDSYEQIYQAVRRCYRFGQKRNVQVNIISSDIESVVLENIHEKEQRMIAMYDNIIGHLKSFQEKGLVANSFFKIDSCDGKIEKDDNFEIFNGDCVEYTKSLPTNSIDYSIFSPPFASLYTYSDSDKDIGNNKDDGDFFTHFGFFLDELYRIMATGRLVSIHCMNLTTSKVRHGYIGIRDFRGDIIRAMQARGFIFASEATIWKCPVVAMQRTKALGLLWKQVKKDSAMSRQGLPDYLLTFRKPGQNKKPISHDPDQFPVDRWQNLAQPTWQNIRQSNTLNFKQARDEKDERHICPLQLDLIERALELWSNPNDVVFSPFTGIGSEGYVSLEMGRKFKGSELKPSYFKCAVDNLRQVSGKPKRLWPSDPTIYDRSSVKGNEPQKPNTIKTINQIEKDESQLNLF